jgi:hypothetical protein
VRKTVIGLDLPPGTLEQATANAAVAGVGLDLRFGDLRDVALEEPAIDILARMVRRLRGAHPSLSGKAADLNVHQSRAARLLVSVLQLAGRW